MCAGLWQEWGGILSNMDTNMDQKINTKANTAKNANKHIYLLTATFCTLFKAFIIAGTGVNLDLCFVHCIVLHICNKITPHIKFFYHMQIHYIYCNVLEM